MAKPVSISLTKFRSSVEAAVEAAVKKHQKFAGPKPTGISVYYLIRGYPIPDEIASKATLGEVQAFANEVASHLTSAVPQLRIAHAGSSSGAHGTVLSVDRHVLIGIPAPPEFLQFEP